MLLLMGQLVPQVNAAEIPQPKALAGACPAGQSVPNNALVRQATAVSDVTDTVDWHWLPVFIEGKRGSLIRTRYSFHANRVMPHQRLTLTMRFDHVQSSPALAYAYPLDGTRFSTGMSRIYFQLMPNQINEAQISLRAPREGGGLVLVTCQNGLSSIYTVTLPGRTLTPDQTPGTVEHDAGGSPIIRIPVTSN